MKQEVQAEVKAKIKPVEEQATQRQEEENLAVFSDQVEDFEKSDLGKKYKTEMDDLVDESFETKEQLLEAAKKDPKLFVKLEKELLFKLKSKLFGDDASSDKSKKRNKEIKDLGVSGKSKTGTRSTETDPTDIKVFDKLSKEEQEKFLKKQGVIK